METIRYYGGSDSTGTSMGDLHYGPGVDGHLTLHYGPSVPCGICNRCRCDDVCPTCGKKK